MTPERIDRYEIKHELGRGGMATVFMAHDPRFRRDVAVKVLPPQFVDQAQFRARFEREAQLIAALEHPAIVPVYDFGEENGQPYLVMRYMPGGSLAERLEKGRIPVAEAAHIIGRLGSALDAVHSKGIIHRDIKPGNVLFDQYGEAYLSDFGIARLTEGTTMLTGDSIIGTPAYMSPEQARGDADIDGRSDIYALGAILYQMLTGALPYEATTPMGVLMKHITEPVPDIRVVRPDLPPTCESVIAGAMAKERDRRFATGSALASALDTVILNPPTLPPASATAAMPPAHPAAPGPVAAPPSPTGRATVYEPAGPPPSPPPPAISRPVTPPPAAAPRPASHPMPRPAAQPAAAGKRSALPIGLVIIGGLVLAGVCAAIVLVVVFSGVLKPAPTQVAAASATPLPPTEIPTLPPTLPPTSDQPGQPTATFPPAAPTLPPGVLFQDDFSDITSGWPQYQGIEGTNAYEGGLYRMLVDVPNQTFVATPGLSFGDVIVRVDADKVAGPEDNFFGLICRYQDRENFYFLIISSDGYYGIGKAEGGQISWIGMSGMQSSTAIHQGKTTNYLRAECLGGQLTLFANEIRLAQVVDRTFSAGDVGLIVGTSETYGANILFDNFLVTSP
jgi:serine/threonine protein kinase